MDVIQLIIVVCANLTCLLMVYLFYRARIKAMEFLISEYRLSQNNDLNALLQVAARVHTKPGYSVVKQMAPGHTPEKMAAFAAFKESMGSELPMTEDGLYSGSWWVAVQKAVEAYLVTSSYHDHDETQ